MNQFLKIFLFLHTSPHTHVCAHTSPPVVLFLILTLKKALEECGKHSFLIVFSKRLFEAERTNPVSPDRLTLQSWQMDTLADLGAVCLPGDA